MTMKSITKNGSPLKAGIWYTISNFLVKGMVFLTTPIFTRLMTSSDVGLYSNISTWITILTIIVTFELASSISIARFDYNDNLDEYISSNLVLGTIITGLFYSLALVFHSYFEAIFNFNFKILNIVFIYLLISPAMQMFQMEKQIHYKHVPIVIISLGSTIIATGCSLAFIFLFDNPLEGRVIGYYAPLIIINLILYVYLMMKGKRIKVKYWRYGIRVSAPLIIHLLASYLLSASDRLMITHFIGSEATAFYSVAYSCGMLVSLLWSSMNNAWSPWAYQMMESKDFKQLKTKSKYYTFFFLFIVFVFMIIGPDILYIMGGKQYMEAMYVIPVVSVGYVFQFLYSFYVNIEFYSKKQVLISIGTIIATIINILLNIIFIPTFGYIAAAYTTLAGYICLFLIHFLFTKYLKKEDWYNSKFFFLIGAVSLFSIPLMCFLYQNQIIRYIFVLAFVLFISLFMLKHKNILLESFKTKNYRMLLSIFGRPK